MDGTLMKETRINKIAGYISNHESNLLPTNSKAFEIITKHTDVEGFINRFQLFPAAAALQKLNIERQIHGEQDTLEQGINQVNKASTKFAVILSD